MRGATVLLALCASVSVVIQPVLGAAVPTNLANQPVPGDSRLHIVQDKRQVALEEEIPPDADAVPRVQTATRARATATRVSTQQRPAGTVAAATSSRARRPITSEEAVATSRVPNVADTPEADATEATSGEVTSVADASEAEATGAISDEATAPADGPEAATTRAAKGTATSGATVAKSSETAKNTTASGTGDGAELPNSERIDYDTKSLEDLDKIWTDSKLEKYVDEWISKRGNHIGWVQDLYTDVFKDVDHGDMSCITSGAECDMKKDFDDFNTVGKGGLYYLFQSVQNYHKYMAETRSRFNEASFMNAMGLKDTISKLKINVEKAPSSKVNVLGLLSGAMGIASGFAGPLAGGALDVMGGVMDKMAESAKGADPLELQNASEEMMNTAIEESTRENLQNIDKILAAVFGGKDSSQDDIPGSMRKANVKNAALAVFGGGRWLQNNPTADLETHWKEVGKLMKKGMAWHLAKAFKHTKIIIRDDMTKDDCQGTNNAWDDKISGCLDMMEFDETPKGTLGGIKDFDLWQEFGMDKLATMRNSLECWQSNGGSEGTPGLLTDPFKSDDAIPPCFFHHHVWKGARQQSNRGWLKLDQSFPGQSGRAVWPEGRD